MTFATVPHSLDKIELLSIIVEVLLYGFSLLMFGGTIWVLLSQRCTRYVNQKILVVACLLLVVSTTHVVIDIIRLVDAFILFADDSPTGPAGYLSKPSQWTFVVRQCVFTIQTLLGDGVILYRCFVVWQSKLIMVLPLLFWCGLGATGFGAAYISHREGVFDRQLLVWLSLFWAFALVTNLLATGLLASRIWYVDCKARQARGPGKSQLQPLLQITVDAGLIYSIFLLAALISFLTNTNFLYPVISPIIAITFYMVIIRVGLANQAKQPKQGSGISLRFSSEGCTDQLRVRATTLMENKFEHGRPLTMAGQSDCAEYLDEGASLGEVMHIA